MSTDTEVISVQQYIAACREPSGAMLAPGPDPLYRYALWRNWCSPMFNTERLLWVMLNPSTADADKDDATIRRCIRFSKEWGFGGMFVVNLFAWRSTNPRALTTAADPVGPLNNQVISDLAFYVKEAVVAWGAKKIVVERGAEVQRILQRSHRGIWCLRKTQDGRPEHPLFVPSETKRVLFAGQADEKSEDSDGETLEQRAVRSGVACEDKVA